MALQALFYQNLPWYQSLARYFYHFHRSIIKEPQTKLTSNESVTPTLNTLLVDRGAGLFALALGARGLGAVTPADHGAWWVGQVVGCATHGLRLLLMEQKQLAK